MVRLWPRGLPPDPGLFTEYPIAACVEPGGFNLGRFGFTEQACVSTQAHLIAKLRGLPTEAEPS